MCPDFFPLPLSEEGGALSDKHLLLFISHSVGCQYYIGAYDTAADRFIPETHGRMAYPAVDYTPPRFGDADFEKRRWVGGTMNEYFAPESLSDANGRRIMWTWVLDHRDQETRERCGTSGDLSLPRVLWLDAKSQTLRMAPAKELRRLRYGKKTTPDVRVDTATKTLPRDMGGRQYELTLAAKECDADKVGVVLCSDLTGQEETRVYFERATRSLVLDTTQSQKIAGVPGRVEKFPLELTEGETLTLDIFMDKSILEVYANDRQAIVRHIFGTANGTAIQVFTENGIAHFTNITFYKMQASNPY